jgi:hypothetical protein
MLDQLRGSHVRIADLGRVLGAHQVRDQGGI